MASLATMRSLFRRHIFLANTNVSFIAKSAFSSSANSTTSSSSSFDASLPRKSKMTIYRSNSNNPFINLSIENFLMQNHKDEKDHNILYLWRNGPSVIMGKFQSVWKECRVHKMEEDNVYLVRRPSGGGAVYQDTGNSIFTFICDRGFNGFNNDAFIARNNRIIIKALESIGVKGVEATGRNDLQFDGKKISGAAFKHTKDTSLHHGTLLLNVDMGALSNYLTPSKAKLESKGVASVAARVMNLKEYKADIDHSKVCDALVKEFTKTYYSGDLETFIQPQIIDIDESIVDREPMVKATMNQLMDKEWRFGKDPKFTHKIENRFAWGSIEVNLDVKGSIIIEAITHSDALDVVFIDLLSKCLVGHDYHKAGIHQSFEKIKEEMIKAKAKDISVDELSMIHECRDWIIANII